ncbi:MAG: GDP-L-fucose synthase [Methylobacter sp.]|nr:GDP-L-fucose synthase [Methylobacter sp.]MDP2099187.1 GDP-L-fucose synthase [Methylobacter sp.]MDP2428970.1 GDP-L-fucose synthase [Methylobacter sp.]MDP3055254.1 GDP-L-fucose synthase [Methylobacter sp.]MDP3361282.1 GDP-L-fucose synthase [Methylobacter sp.]
MKIDKHSKIYIAGHQGLAGSAIVRELQRQGYANLVWRSHAELDLEDAAATLQFFQQQRPDIVFLAAAKVGGIHANNSYPVDFLMSNLLIETNVCRAAYAANVKRLIFLGSSCIYPRDCPQPIKEDYLLTGALEPTNRAYALAKIAGIEMCWSYNRQYGTRWLAAMPTNLYGQGDNYDLNNSHVLPALVRKIHEAKMAAAAEVVLWGSGTPKREFLYVDDLANALVFLAALDEPRYHALTQAEQCPLINVGTGEDLTIRTLADMIAEVIGYSGRFVQDTSKPDGTPRKVLDVSRIRQLGWAARMPLKTGIQLTYQAFADSWA